MRTKKTYPSHISTPGCAYNPGDGRKSTSWGTHQSRGGVSPRACNTGFEAPGNLHKTPHSYHRQVLQHWGGEPTSTKKQTQ